MQWILKQNFSNKICLIINGQYLKSFKPIIHKPGFSFKRSIIEASKRTFDTLKPPNGTMFFSIFITDNYYSKKRLLIVLSNIANNSFKRILSEFNFLCTVVNGRKKVTDENHKIARSSRQLQLEVHTISMVWSVNLHFFRRSVTFSGKIDHKFALLFCWLGGVDFLTVIL